MSLLKPSTLKQLGRSVPAAAAEQVSSTCGSVQSREPTVGVNLQSSEVCVALQDSSPAAVGRQASVADRKVNLLTFLPLKHQHSVSSLVSI